MIDIEMFAHLDKYCSEEWKALTLDHAKRYLYDIWRNKKIPKRKKARDRMRLWIKNWLDGLIELATKCKKSLD